MFIYLSKLLPPLVYPMGLVCLLILAGLFTQRRVRLQRVLLLSGLLILWLSGTRLLSDPLTYWLEKQYPTPPELQRSRLEAAPGGRLAQPVAPVIVVLGGGSGPANPPRQIPEIGDSATNRLMYAAYLYKHGAAEHILLSCGIIEWMGDQGSPTDDMRFILNALGVPDSAIWIEDQSRNTYENAVYSQKILAEKGISEVLLVTSGFHMPRSVALFKKVGLTVIPAPSDITITDNDMASLVSLNPATQLLNIAPLTLGNTSCYPRPLKEIAGDAWVYRLRGGWVLAQSWSGSFEIRGIRNR